MRLPFVVLPRALFDQHRAETRRAIDALRAKPHDFQVERLRRDAAALDQVWERHGTPYCPDTPGVHGAYGAQWWCSGCRTPWPCADARIVLEAREGSFARDYGSLTLPLADEATTEDGS